ncbi:MAG: LytTR family transcriptional regulator DNA-binding domain-containing protein [Oscillospiraceae bacterium]|nr:LytTR family transcriptional regulator DNA-binding domain-containing protein [Oscillospiraceae bacterium]MDE7278916.1 LytTR family transcriptional regulator DNA-binding domain-containing protein [Oscillospiraceae bacterium]
MEVLICSARKPIWKRLFALTDKLLCRKKNRYMSVNTNLFTSRCAILAAVKKYGTSGSAIVIIDVGSFEDWKSIAEELERTSRGMKICLVSESDREAAEAINRLSSLCGYVREGQLPEMYAEVIDRLCRRLRTICGGIAVTRYSNLEKIIPYCDIYYIETVKQTHMCSIVHKNGRDEIRAEISKLIGDLDSRFRLARSSTIVNLSAVKSVKNSEIFFPDGSSCFCTDKYSAEILPVIRTGEAIL